MEDFNKKIEKMKKAIEKYEKCDKNEGKEIVEGYMNYVIVAAKDIIRSPIEDKFKPTMAEMVKKTDPIEPVKKFEIKCDDETFIEEDVSRFYYLNLQCGMQHWISDWRQVSLIKYAPCSWVALKLKQTGQKCQIGVITKDKVYWYQISKTDTVIKISTYQDKDVLAKVKLIRRLDSIKAEDLTEFDKSRLAEATEREKIDNEQFEKRK